MAKKSKEQEQILEELNYRQQLFCEKMIELKGNQRQAAIAAGYSVKCASQQANYLLSNPHINKYIASIKNDLGIKIGITREKLANEVAKSAFADVAELFNIDGSFKPIADMGEGIRGAIASVETFEVTAGGEVIGETKKIKLNDKTRSQTLLAELLGYKAPIKTEVAVSGGVVELPKKDLHNDQ
jgi:phage terminase small subunit